MDSHAALTILASSTTGKTLASRMPCRALRRHWTFVQQCPHRIGVRPGPLNHTRTEPHCKTLITEPLPLGSPGRACGHRTGAMVQHVLLASPRAACANMIGRPRVQVGYKVRFLSGPSSGLAHPDMSFG